MAIERVEGTPFIVAGNVCDWDGKLSKGIETWANELKTIYAKDEGEHRVEWGIFFNDLKKEIVKSLKECDQNLVNQWNRIYHHSLSLQGVNKQLGDTKAVVGQQAIGLAAGVPAAAGVGAVACPLFKLCMKFFSK